MIHSYKPVLVAAGATVQLSGSHISGFLCTTSGNITINRLNGPTGSTTIVTALPVTAGLWVDIPIFLGVNGGTVVSAGGAVGVLTTS